MTEPEAATTTDRPASHARMSARVPYLVALAIAGYFAQGSVQLGVGGLIDPGPGLWPLAISVLLGLCSMIGLVTANDEDVEEFRGRLLRPAMGGAVLCLFVLLFERVGLILTGVIVMFFWFKVLARESWAVAISLAVGCTAVAYVLFVIVLGAVFPADIVASLWQGR